MKSSHSSHKYSSLKTTDDNGDDNDVELQFKKKIREQDENLESLSHSVSRLGDLSLIISNEITSQNKLLSDLEYDVESAESKTSYLMDKTKELIKRTGGGKDWCIIIVLFAILLTLILLVIYT